MGRVICNGWEFGCPHAIGPDASPVIPDSHPPNLPKPGELRCGHISVVKQIKTQNPNLTPREVEDRRTYPTCEAIRQRGCPTLKFFDGDAERRKSLSDLWQKA